MFVIVIGPAAAGKTSLAIKLAENGILINLDPATSIDADIDIRKWIRVEDVQKKYSLGINGALLKSMELISENNEWIKKDKNEIKLLREAAKITSEAFQEIKEMIKPGIREEDIMFEIARKFREKGGEKPSFEIIVASGANGAYPHARVGKTKIQPNDVVVIDMGVYYKNYASDMTRTIIVGKPDSEANKVYEIVLL